MSKYVYAYRIPKTGKVYLYGVCMLRKLKFHDYWFQINVRSFRRRNHAKKFAKR